MKKTILNLNERGYTLIELLAVMVVLIATGGIIVSIMISSLRGSNRAATVNDVRQNGNYTIGQMSKMISYAQSFDGVSIDGINFNTNCVVTVPPSPTPMPTPVPYTTIKITNFDRNQITFSCTGGTISSNSASMIDTNNFSVSSCNFYCTQDSSSGSPIINIHFILSKANAGAFVESNASISFDTSITLRNK